jgi:hypothetical protein
MRIPRARSSALAPTSVVEQRNNDIELLLVSRPIGVENAERFLRIGVLSATVHPGNSHSLLVTREISDATTSTGIGCLNSWTASANSECPHAEKGTPEPLSSLYDSHSPLLHHFRQIATRDAVLAVPTDAQQNDYDRKAAALEHALS